MLIDKRTNRCCITYDITLTLTHISIKKINATTTNTNIKLLPIFRIPISSAFCNKSVRHVCSFVFFFLVVVGFHFSIKIKLKIFNFVSFLLSKKLYSTTIESNRCFFLHKLEFKWNDYKKATKYQMLYFVHIFRELFETIIIIITTAYVICMLFNIDWFDYYICGLASDGRNCDKLHHKLSLLYLMALFFIQLVHKISDRPLVCENLSNN